MKSITTMLLLATCAAAHPLDRLHDAVATVESNHNPAAVGDGGRALGHLQIHAAVVLDVNRAYLTDYAHRDMHDPEYARAVFNHYLALWATEERLGRPVTDEDRARIWNGGPNGWRRKATEPYWRKVQRRLK